MAAIISKVPMDFQEKQDHICTFCGFKSTLISKLEYHVRQHTREKPFYCDLCNRGFSLKPNLKLHIRRVHQGIKPVYENKHKCSLCPYATYKRSTLETHTKRHTAKHDFKCEQPNCEYAAKTSQELIRHATWTHGEERKYLCQFSNCGYRGKTNQVLRQHYMKHSENRPFVCDVPECNYRAKRKDALILHKLGGHNGGNKPFACSTCSHRTSCKVRLKNHELTHSQEKSIKCNFSGCAFLCQTKTRLNEHVQNRHRKRTFKCDVAGCLSIAASRTNLEVHKKHVHYEKVYQCPHCDYRGAMPSVLRKHIVRHNVGQRIPCPIKGCPFKTKSLKYLEKHVSYHKASLACPKACGYVGTSRFSLKRHVKIHDPTGRRFHCLLCPKHYHGNSNLQAHLKSHTQEKPFQCPVCSYGAVRKVDIARHVSIFHSNLFTEFVCDERFICGHCYVNFGNAIGLAIHTIKLKTAIVELTRLQLKFDSSSMQLGGNRLLKPAETLICNDECVINSNELK